MSRHEGVSCDSCLKSNFRGRRYKCLICYDYDLCASCYETGATSTRHTTDHAMQCILTRSDFDVFYGGEPVSVEQPQSFTCPFCAKMGFNETSLQEHAAADHSDATNEVVCPVCAALPGGDPNHMTDDLAVHLTMEHRQPRDFASVLSTDEPAAQGIRHVRRIPPSRGSGARARTRNILQGGLSPQTAQRDSMDPIAELLSQLSSVRSRAAAQNVSSQLHQLEIQLQQSGGGREPRLQRRPEKSSSSNSTSVSTSAATASANAVTSGTLLDLCVQPHKPNPQFLLSRLAADNDSTDSELRQEKEQHSLFVQELLLSTLSGPSASIASDALADVTQRDHAVEAEQPQPAPVTSSQQTPQSSGAWPASGAAPPVVTNAGSQWLDLGSRDVAPPPLDGVLPRVLVTKTSKADA